MIIFGVVRIKKNHHYRNQIICWWVSFDKKKCSEQFIKLTRDVDGFEFGKRIKFIFSMQFFRYQIPVCRISTFFVCCFLFSPFSYILNELMLMPMHILCLKEIWTFFTCHVQSQMWNKFILKRKAKLSKKCSALWTWYAPTVFFLHFFNRKIYACIVSLKLMEPMLSITFGISVQPFVQILGFPHR